MCKRKSVFPLMRWISISSLAFLMACTGGDLSVKTDLDETYSVKDSAVTVEPIDDWAQYRASVAENAKLTGQLKELHDERIDVYRSQKRYTEALEFIRSDEYEKVALNPIFAEEKWLNKYSDVPIPFVQIKFRAIFEDLNGDKKPTSYKRLTCFSPATDSRGIEDKASAFWQLSLKVCNKYADLGEVKRLQIVDL